MALKGRSLDKKKTKNLFLLSPYSKHELGLLLLTKQDSKLSRLNLFRLSELREIKSRYPKWPTTWNFRFRKISVICNAPEKYSDREITINMTKEKESHRTGTMTLLNRLLLKISLKCCLRWRARLKDLLLSDRGTFISKFKKNYNLDRILKKIIIYF